MSLGEINATLTREIDFQQRLVNIARVCAGAIDAHSVTVVVDEPKRRIIRATASAADEQTPVSEPLIPIRIDKNVRVAVPIMIADASVGVLYAETAAPLSPEKVELLHMIAAQLATAIEDRRLVAQHERSDSALRLLASASAQLSESLELEQVLAKIGPITVPALADWCVVDIEESGVMRPVAWAHVDSQLADVVGELHRKYPSSMTSGRGRVQRTKEPLLVSEVTDDQLRDYARDDEHLRLLQALTPRSLMSVPLVARDRSLGVVSFVLSGRERRYDASDLALATDLTRCIALALENARLYRDLQSAMREREWRDRHLHMIFRQVPGAVWAVDRELIITYSTGRLLETPGVVGKDAIGRSLYELLETDDPASPPIFHHLAALHGDSQFYEYLWRDRWYAVLIDPLLDEDGRVDGAVGASFDITNRRLVAERLARSERQLSEAQQVAHFGSFEWDVATNVLCWSDELQRICGFEPGQFGGTFESFLATVPEEDQQWTRELLLAAFARQEPFTYDHRIRRTDGAIRLLRSRGDVVKDESGRPVRVVGTCWDVTEQVEVLKRLEEETKRAHAAIQARDEFLSIAAHEIRGPINSIHLAIQALRQGKVGPETTERFLEIIERQDRRLSEFVEELLDLARIRAGRFEIERRSVKLDEVVHDVVERVAPELARSGSSLSVSVEPSVEGEWDKSRLDQVLFNLLTNAIKFGEGKPIELAVSEHDSRATIAVTDHGTGIDPKFRARLFDPFERGVSVRHYGGLGLGLHIVNTIVTALGGSVKVESEPGHGATFMVELPKATRSANDAHLGSR